MDVYQKGMSEGMHSDFGQLILDQVNEKQRVLEGQNILLERNYTQSKA